MSLSFQDLSSIRNYFLCAYFTGRNLKYRNKSDFFHGYTEHVKAQGTEDPESFCDALPTNYSLVLSLSHFLSQKKRQGNSCSFENTCRFCLNAKQFVILKITLYYLTYHSILCSYASSLTTNLECVCTYSGYICTHKNTCLYPKTYMEAALMFPEV